jgi:hypothetical protein
MPGHALSWKAGMNGTPWICIFAFVAALTFSAATQEIPANEEFPPLVLVRIIRMPTVECTEKAEHGISVVALVS